jgi:protein SCO1/2
MSRITPLLLTLAALAGLERPTQARACADCDAHAAHAAAPAGRQRYLRASLRLQPPDVSLVDQDGRPVRLPDLLTGDAPVALEFVFTTCTTICPVMSASFAGLQRHAGELPGLRLISISIDPEQDRPAVLRAYAARFHASPAWRFYTGTEADVRAVLVAFDAFSGGKANHRPLTFVRGAGGETWTRLDGLATGDDLARELRDLHASR